MNAQSALILLE